MAYFTTRRPLRLPSTPPPRPAAGVRICSSSRLVSGSPTGGSLVARGRGFSGARSPTGNALAFAPACVGCFATWAWACACPCAWGCFAREDAALEELFADFTSLAAALATLADAFFRSPRRASFFREPGFAAPDFFLGLGFATVDVRGDIAPGP